MNQRMNERRMSRSGLPLALGAAALVLCGCLVRAEPGPPPRGAPPPVFVDRPVIVGVPPGQIRREEVHERNAERKQEHEERKEDRKDEHERAKHGKGHGHDDGHDHDRD
jgi:hypothetical protein